MDKRKSRYPLVLTSHVSIPWVPAVNLDITQKSLAVIQITEIQYLITDFQYLITDFQ